MASLSPTADMTFNFPFPKENSLLGMLLCGELSLEEKAIVCFGVGSSGGKRGFNRRK